MSIAKIKKSLRQLKTDVKPVIVQRKRHAKSKPDRWKSTKTGEKYEYNTFELQELIKDIDVYLSALK